MYAGDRRISDHDDLSPCSPSEPLIPIFISFSKQFGKMMIKYCLQKEAVSFSYSYDYYTSSLITGMYQD
jgi:hypothetical protein